MKRSAIFLGIMLSFIACDKENTVLESPLNEPQAAAQSDEIKVNLTIINSEVPETQTKAWRKTGFADNDVVFVFFTGAAAPKYLEMKYSSSTGKWTATPKNGLVLASDLGSSGMMTAIYLPYGSGSTVISDGTNFKFDGPAYNGYFLRAQRVDYTLQGGVLSGTLNMVAPAVKNYELFTHFDVDNADASHSYTMSQDYVKPILLTSISAAGYITHTYGSLGDEMTGYMDGTHLCFSGALEYGKAMTENDYQFSVEDHTASKVYTRDVGKKTIGNNNLYIGLRSLTNVMYWRDYDYVDLGLSVKWAVTNIIATDDYEYGDLYAWGETEHYYDYRTISLTGPLNGWKSGMEAGYSNSTYYSESRGRKNFNPGSPLPIQYDVAHSVMLGKWRMPTRAEMEELLNSSNCTWEWKTRSSRKGYLVTSKKEGFTGRSIFLPAAGYVQGTTLHEVNTGGQYWTSDRGCYLQIYDNQNTLLTNFYSYPYYGMSIRPVCK